jgi:hypothetical protein
MGGDTDPAPTLDDLAADSPELSPAWGAWCPDEESQVAQDLAVEADASAAAEEHNLMTGHAAVATLSLPDAVAVDTGIQLLSFPFCVRYNGRPWRSMIFVTPGPDEAATTAAQVVDLLNQVATRKGFQALFSATGGTCPAL